MTKKAKHTLTPKLRFPEFRNGLGWDTCSLIDLADPNVRWSFIGGPFGSNLKASDYTPKGIRIIQLQNIGDGEFLDEYKIYTSDEKADELLSCNAYAGEIVMSKMGDPVGRACLTPTFEKRFLMCSDGIRLVVDEKRFEKMFVFLAINNGVFRQRVDSSATGSTRKRIGLDTLRQLPIEIPARAEQQKIAECLSSLDELIAAEGRKLEALRAHKKGLMQQLFPRPGETRPRLRFPEFQNAPEWEKKLLSNICEVNPRCEELPDSFIYIDLESVEAGQLIARNMISRVGAPSRAQRLLNKCDVIFQLVRPYQRNNLLFIFDDGHEYVASTGYAQLRAHGSPEFLFHLIHTYSFVTKVIAKCTGSNYPAINSSDLAEIEIAVPQSPDEQQQIADCLSSLDGQITTQAQKLATLQTHKKGLMQQLFPSPEEAEA